jgi:plasmid stabilization system protein ParE
LKRITFHQDARAELLESAHYYEERNQGLGQSFIDDVEAAIDEIQQNPHACALVSSELRRKIIRRFPFGLLYVEESDRIRIIAVAHFKRRPEYWRDRLS